VEGPSRAVVAPLSAPTLRLGVIVSLLGVLSVSDAHAQRIPRDEYLRYLPLELPSIVRQTSGSVAMSLYGDPTSSGYTDSSPVDGIDDRRHAVLERLAVRFAPLLVLNTTAAPMSFQRFMEREAAFPLHLDTWDVAGDDPRLVRSEEIDWNELADAPCPTPGPAVASASADCRLLSLVEQFDPYTPGPAYVRGAVDARRSEVSVMFFDFPGDDEETWRDEFVNPFTGRLSPEYSGFTKAYVHPFIETAGDGYEFALQYWLFYPYNDGGLNHEGDWEHINVFVKPLSRLHEPLGESDVEEILEGGRSDSGPDQLVIQRIDYYFHRNVMTLDYTQPNVYQPREQWEQEVASRTVERRGERWFWERLRFYAYRDDAETEINTHPIGFVGADNKGTDQLLKSPGGSNRDSHGTYPFPGLYKDTGMAGSAEQISQTFDHREYFASGAGDALGEDAGYGRGSVVSLASPERLQLVPDGERVSPLVKSDVGARRDWAWLVLPIRWGYPAAESPFAGIISYADMGNISVVGPAYNGGWNRSGDAAGFKDYSPHRFGSLFPLTWQDGFANDLGYLNLTGPTLIILPPFNLVWRVVAGTARTAFGSPSPIFHPSENLPYRFVGLEPGVAWVDFSSDFVSLFRNRTQIDDIADRLLDAVNRADSIVGRETEFVENSAMLNLQVSLYLGDRFAGENAIRHGSALMGLDVELPTLGEVFELRGDLDFWEYSGSLRYNLTTGSLMPFIKAGYGISWYRIENATTNGELLPEPDGPWIGRPSSGDLGSWLPNTWHAGAGLEWVPIRSVADFPLGLDLGVRAEAAFYRHSLGLDIDTVVPTSSGLLVSAGTAKSPVVTRPVYSLSLTLGF